MDDQDEDIYNKIRILYENKFIREGWVPANMQYSTPIKYKTPKQSTKQYLDYSPTINLNTYSLTRYYLSNQQHILSPQHSQRLKVRQTRSETGEVYIQCNYVGVSQKNSRREDNKKIYRSLKTSHSQEEKHNDRQSLSANKKSKKNHSPFTGQNLKKKTIIQMIESTKKEKKQNFPQKPQNDKVHKLNLTVKQNVPNENRARMQSLAIYRNKKLNQQAKKSRLRAFSERRHIVNPQFLEKEGQINPWAVIQTQY